MAIETFALVAIKELLKVTFKKLPLWARIPVIIAGLLIALLLFGSVIGIIWIVYSFISSGVWKFLPAEVAASIVAGLFGVFTLLIGNYLTKESEIRSTLRLKEIESQEKLLEKKAEFYSEMIDKLFALFTDSIKVEDVLKDFYGKLYIQGSPKVTSSFLEIVENIKANGNNQQMLEDNIRPQADKLMADLRKELNQARREISLLYNPSSFNE